MWAAKTLQVHSVHGRLGAFQPLSVKVLNWIDEDGWLKNINTTRENVLRSTLRHMELQSVVGKETELLNCILRVFKRLYSSSAMEIDAGM